MPSGRDEIGAAAHRRGAPDHVVDIAVPDDALLADYLALRTRGDRHDDFFVAESAHVVRRVVQSGCAIRSLLLTPAAAAALADVVASVLAPVYVASQSVLEQIVGFDLHRGALASVQRWPLRSLDDVCANARVVALLEQVNDHENLGVLFRNAAAFGVDAVLLDRECADPLYRRSVRVSIGHVCTVPWTRYESLDEVRAAGFTVVAFTPAGEVAIDEFPWPERCALAFGAEGPGLSEATLAGADVRVRIPMPGGVDSLNVANAAAVAFYEARRGKL